MQVLVGEGERQSAVSLQRRLRCRPPVTGDSSPRPVSLDWQALSWGTCLDIIIHLTEYLLGARDLTTFS